MLYNKKPLVQSVVEPTDTNVYWVQVIPNSTDTPIIKTFHNGAWIPLTGTPASIQDLLDLKAPLHNPKFTGDATLNGEPISTNNLNGTNYLIVYGTGTPEQNAAELQDAYNEAKKMPRYLGDIPFGDTSIYYKGQTFYYNNNIYVKAIRQFSNMGTAVPNIDYSIIAEEAKSTCTTLIVAPGKYTFNKANDFTIDTPSVNIVSLTGNRDVQINGIKVTAGRNVLIKGIDCGTNPIQLSNCIDNTLMFENCKGGDYSFSTDNSDLFGTFIDCKAGCSSFNVGDDVSDTSKFIRCEADYNSFGNSCYHLYGYFEDCIGTSGCFGQTSKNGTTEVGAEFRGCKATDHSFGYNSILTGAKFINCEATANSFGGGGQEYDGDASIDSTTEFINCKAIGSYNFGSGRCALNNPKFRHCYAKGNYNFAGQNTSVSGKYYYCNDDFENTAGKISQGTVVMYCTVKDVAIANKGI